MSKRGELGRKGSGHRRSRGVEMSELALKGLIPVISYGFECGCFCLFNDADFVTSGK